MPYPRVTIKFCTRCKWNLRASWYLQELLQTFGEQLGEVALVPFESGVFRVETQRDDTSDEVLVWDRVKDGGFPDSKILKQRVRDTLFPQDKLGHVDKANKNEGRLVVETDKETETETETGCVECNEESCLKSND
ncbi:CYFA0S13e00430g1_1 [Cyberlindnera fabianii]|uniref:CYFA0S13e00430g1_1 n=1 Tax=Cyberlindnera fabianii TaxID=36022 RepID=A0A061BAF7_CYBFA|nr:CYFA0S13e00430g1_1 [Cyberlindnera fabianii]